MFQIVLSSLQEQKKTVYHVKLKRSLWKHLRKNTTSGVSVARWILRTAQATTGGLMSLKSNSQPGICRQWITLHNSTSVKSVILHFLL